ncbi:tRNA (N6-threonylcarbamoyladenosine(37)-N6)-methyltransferase TrmO [Thalassomonas actiniarum]|uniref:tRNA (N6-threonylcarbamoyladenosine(37)-N6)-methyltransferase TrmO n=1 Tax=Thalassomonas actiniarum TaxID=485447 RepID=A0AAE9YUJ2_9GAMM|nr:tRNA (N6-threonylcarbamoyladenosine(37)-N6)-methyltransferase TrmO [Thalassomonas actiniarum]WDE01371.1 tRNA (N6-threonylcarbamoyladenosine(37)-N6)-methyltransferase TrmO [Thalassomonas actiniarum]
MNQQITLDIIGYVSSPYKEKFAIPRQPGIVSAAKGHIELAGQANNIELVRGLEQFSHLWLMFIFHGTSAQGWKPLVRPPRLGGNKKLGVLATRSTFRPNPVGMSVVKLEDIRVENKSVKLGISGLDLLDQTPIIDIKPYVPYSDALYDASAGFAQESPADSLNISFSSQAKQDLLKFHQAYPELEQLISQVLAQDPRPAYKSGQADDKRYGMHLHQFNILWQMKDLTRAEVIAIEKIAR